MLNSKMKVGHNIGMRTFSANSKLNDVINLYLDVKLMGKGMAYGDLPFPCTGCPLPDVGNIYLIRTD